MIISTKTSNRNPMGANGTSRLPMGSHGCMGNFLWENLSKPYSISGGLTLSLCALLLLESQMIWILLLKLLLQEYLVILIYKKLKKKKNLLSKNLLKMILHKRKINLNLIFLIQQPLALDFSLHWSHLFFFFFFLTFQFNRCVCSLLLTLIAS